MASAEVALPTRPENITFLQKTTDTPTNAFERYFHPPSKVVNFVNVCSGLSLPVVDLAGLHTGDSAARAEIVKQLGKAASEFGFFQMINHGVSEEKTDELQRIVREFFALPVDVKERGEDPNDCLLGYNGRLSHRGSETPWMEYLALWYRPTPTQENFAKKVWPGGNPTFCNLVTEWCDGVERLALQVLELLAESLGLKPDSLTKHLKDPGNLLASLRLHHYPRCPHPSRCMGAGAHSDRSVMTILKQDEVGGLQVRVGDEFIDVTPVPGALVVNIGDIFEAWSNGRFKSCEHRVLVKSEVDRFSMLYFVHGPPYDFVIRSPPELVDEEHPSLYVPFTFGEYKANSQRLYKRGIIAREDTLGFALRKKIETII